MALKVSSGTAAVAVASQWIGTPYKWGGGHSGPVPIGTPVDCSGLVDQVFGVTGTTFQQVKMGSGISSLPNASAGDLIFFGPIAPGEPHHVGIYIGKGLMIDAPHTGTTVRTDNVSGFGPIYAIRRLVPSGPDASNTQQGGNLQFTYAQLEAVWIQAGGNQQYDAMAAAIAMAESGGNSTASNINSNGTLDRGLWQINSSNGSGSSFDVMTNARAAVSMSGGGTNWRPWCTAYSDGACGSKGGTYLGQGAPYQKFLNASVTPDYSAPINGTNASANQGGAQTDLSLKIPSWMCPLDPGLCLAQSGTAGIIGQAIQGVVGTVLNPIFTLISGMLGITGGGILMIAGLYMMVKQTETYQTAKQGAQTAVGTGALVFGPEGLAVEGAEGGAATRMRANAARQRPLTNQQLVRREARRYGTQQTIKRLAPSP